VIPHGGGAVPYHWGRYRGLSLEQRQRPLEPLLHNVFLETCVYHEPGIRFLNQIIPVDNILFGSEMIGAVRGHDPSTGEYFDDDEVA
jgi:4-oxalmesaconate hydratase